VKVYFDFKPEVGMQDHSSGLP